MKIVMAHFRDISGVSGGLERVLCNFSNEMSKRGHDVHILTYDTSETGIPLFPFRKKTLKYTTFGARGKNPLKFPFLRRSAVNGLVPKESLPWRHGMKLIEILISFLMQESSLMRSILMSSLSISTQPVDL